MAGDHGRSGREPIDVTTFADQPERPYIIEHLWPVKSVLGIAGEEGDGKTLLADQALRELLRGDQVLGFFDVGSAAPKRALFIDTEMGEADGAERHQEMVKRGLDVQPDQLYWFFPDGLALDRDDGYKEVDSAIQAVRPDIIWIDSAINAVTEAEEGTPVKKLFNALSRLMKEHDLLGVGLTLHTRKQGQERRQRRFDDLFGSREWKGRLGSLVYIEGSTATAWKNRGGRIGKVWPTRDAGRPRAVLHRPGLADDNARPFQIVVPNDTATVDDAALEEQVKLILREQPDELFKNDLATRLSTRKSDALRVIGRMQDQGVVIPNQPRQRLRLAPEDQVDGDEERSGSGSL